MLEDPPLEMAGPRIVETGLLELFPHFLRHAGSDQSVDEIAEDLAEARVKSWGHAVPVRLGDVRDPVSLRVSASGLKRLDPGVLEPPLAGRWLDGSDVADDLGASAARPSCSRPTASSAASSRMPTRPRWPP